MKITELVKESWDKIGHRYDSYRDHTKINAELEQFTKFLPQKGTILDVGSGSGIPVAKYLTEKGFKIIGIDISKKMVELAKKNVPKATFRQQDVLQMDFEDSSFDGIICVYTLWHVPRKKHAEIFKKFYELLKSNGILVINTGIRESEGLSLFYGQPMLWSNNSPKKTLQAIKELGFEILFEDILERGGE
ncbi:MAG: class I SAM-dependent methyltransferase, partial [Asgard group archaeon]|nr:class I SAM-dependent methyltransferase [Asgard group archaeon]